MHVLDDTYILDNVVKYTFSDRSEKCVLEVRPEGAEPFYKEFSNYPLTTAHINAIFEYSKLSVSGNISCAFYSENLAMSNKPSVKKLFENDEDFRKNLLQFKTRIDRMQKELFEMSSDIHKFLNP